MGTTVVTYDIECDNLLKDVTTIWCISIKVNEQETKAYSDSALPHSSGSIKQALEILQDADIIIGHKIISFDHAVILKLYDIDLYKKKNIDTLLIAKMAIQNLYPYDVQMPHLDTSLYGSYSLKAFAQRLDKNFSKLDYDDWTKLTDEMLVYCIRDTDVTHKLYRFLESLSTYPPPEAIILENGIKEIVTYQEYYGFTLDVKKAEKLRDKLLLASHTINRKLQKTFRPMMLKDGEEEAPNKVFTRKKYIPNNTYIPLLGTQPSSL